MNPKATCYLLKKFVTAMGYWFIAKGYFWRTVSQQEIDYAVEEAGKLEAFEIKWRVPIAFVNAYDAQITVVNKDNFRRFLK